MMGHNICLKALYGKLSLNYLFYPFSSVAVFKFDSQTELSTETNQHIKISEL